MELKKIFPETHEFYRKISKIDIKYSSEYYHLIDQSVKNGNDDRKPLKMSPKVNYNGYFLPDIYSYNLNIDFDSCIKEILKQYNSEIDQSKTFDSFLESLHDKLSKLNQTLIRFKSIFSEKPAILIVKKSIEDYAKTDALSLSMFDIHYNFISKKNDYGKIVEFIKAQIIVTKKFIKQIKLIQEDSFSYIFHAKPPISEQYHPKLTKKQLALLFYFLREQWVIHPLAESTSVGHGLSLMTGYEAEQIRKTLPSVDHELKAHYITKNIKDVDNIISKLNKVLERLSRFQSEMN